MGNAGTDHAKATYRTMMLGWSMVIISVLHLLMIACHMMARHLGLWRLGNRRQGVLGQHHLQ